MANQYYVAVKPNVQQGVQTTIQLLALDAYGNLVRSYSGTATVTVTDAGGTATASSTTATFTNGVGTLNVTFATVGPQTVTVPGTITLSGSLTPLTVSGSALLNVNQPTVAESYLALLPSVVKAGKAVTVELVAVDATGHLVQSYDVSNGDPDPDVDGR